MDFHTFLAEILHSYTIDEKWIPLVVVIFVIVVLLCVYVIFFYIRVFLSWIFGVNSLIQGQKEQTEILWEILHEQEEIRYELALIKKNTTDFSKKKLTEGAQKPPQKHYENFEKNNKWLPKRSEKNSENIIDDTEFLGKDPENFPKNSENTTIRPSEKPKNSHKKRWIARKK